MKEELLKLSNNKSYYYKNKTDIDDYNKFEKYIARKLGQGSYGQAYLLKNGK
jgi:hypothetical protein